MKKVTKMKNIKNLIKHFQIIGFIWFIPALLAVFLFSSAASCEGEYENELWFHNATSDTIVFVSKCRQPNGEVYPIHYRRFFPNESGIIGASQKFSTFEMINYQYESNNVEILIHYPTCPSCGGTKVESDPDHGEHYYIDINPLVSWEPPLCYLPDSINHFYNKNSWVIVKGGTKGDADIATFTITEKDLQQKE